MNILVLKTAMVFSLRWIFSGSRLGPDQQGPLVSGRGDYPADVETVALQCFDVVVHRRPETNLRGVLLGIKVALDNEAVGESTHMADYPVDEFVIHVMQAVESSDQVEAAQVHAAAEETTDAEPDQADDAASDEAK